MFSVALSNFLRLSSGITFGHSCTSSDTSCSSSSAGPPSRLRCRFQGKTSTAWNGRLDAPFSVDEASVKEAAVACCVPFLLVSPVFVRGSGMDVFTCVTRRFVCKHSILARSVFVLHGHRLNRDIAVVLTVLCCDLDIF